MRINTKKWSLLIFFFLLINFVTAQNNTDLQTNTFWNNVRYGGGLGVSTGTGFFSATIAPSAIYDFNPQFSLGVGLNGTYNRSKDFFKSTIVGGSVIGLFNPIEALQLSAEFEELNVSRNFDSPDFQDENYWYPALFMGIGYRSQNVTFGIRYDVLYDESRSIYIDPWAPSVRFYF